MREHAIRVAFGIFGIALLLIGTIGIFVPVLPGFLFIVFSMACFSKSSKKMHKLLIENRFIKPILKTYSKTHALPMKAKLLIIFSIWAIAGIDFFILKEMWVKASIVFSAVALSIYLMTMKTLHKKINIFANK